MKKRLFLFILLMILIPLMLPAGEGFHFAVLGDRTGSADQEAFVEVVRDISRMYPDFVMTVGDHIEGYSDGMADAEEWDSVLSVLDIIDCPLYMTPGNHDIYTEETEKLYVKKTAFKPFYSFDYKNAHFVVLNNAEVDDYSGLEKIQKMWLKKDLNRNRNRENIFVFMHKPFWADGIAEGKEDSLHLLFKENNVDAVFTGHWHQYAYDEFDDIKYILVGSSGGDYHEKENVELGLFYQYLWCNVNGEKLSVTLMKSGQTYSQDLINIDEEKLIYSIPNKLIKAEAELEGERKEEIRGRVRIINVTDKDIENELRWSSGENWKIHPEKMNIEIQSHDTSEVIFGLNLKGDVYPLPSLNFVYPFGRNKKYEYNSNLWLNKTVSCPKMENFVSVDGNIDRNEWKNSEKIVDFCSLEGTPAGIQDTRIYLQHGEGKLYLGIKCYEERVNSIRTEQTERDSPVYQDDCFGILISPEEGLIYHLYINPEGVIWDQKVDLRKGKQEESWNVSCNIGTEIKEDFWTVEISIPLDELDIEEDEFKVNFRRKQTSPAESGFWMPDWSYNTLKYGNIMLK